jgi:hypothetical protein
VGLIATTPTPQLAAVDVIESVYVPAALTNPHIEAFGPVVVAELIWTPAVPPNDIAVTGWLDLMPMMTKPPAGATTLLMVMVAPAVLPV